MDGAKFSPRAKSKYTESCAVAGCKHKTNSNFSICFHRFPKPNDSMVYRKNYFGKMEKVDKFKAWQLAVKIKKVTKKTKVCSLHFKREDYILPDITSKKRRLKKIAVPSLNLPNTSHAVVERSNARLQRQLKRNNVEEKRNETFTNTENPSIVVYEHLGDTAPVLEARNSPGNLHELVVEDTKNTFVNCANTCENFDKLPVLMKEIGVQVKSGDIICKFTNFIKNERDLSTVTGINSFKVLNCIVEMVSLAFGDTSQHNNIKMNLYDKVVMTYVKLKQNLSYSFLALLFHSYSDTHCRRVFYDTLAMLSETLKVAIKWPSKEEISKNMPSCFEGFEDVRVVIDCTEIFIQEPKNLCCQIITHSNYKKARTAKIMTGVAPDGSIIYISKPWGGRASDPRIFENSDIIQLLEPGDAIMVDKGFTIDEICTKNRWKLIRPPFLKDKKQFSQSESLMTAKIAKARVHVERSNQRIKMFKILGEKMSVKLVPYLNLIFLVVCTTINLCSPILKDDKFMKQAVYPAK